VQSFETELLTQEENLSGLAAINRELIARAEAIGSPRGGRMIAMPMAATDAASLQSAIHANVAIGSTLFTDEHSGYVGLDGVFFRHETVNHTAGEYVQGIASTNGIESVWAVLKRGVYGVYHKVSKKHLGRYVDEFAFRLNDGDVKRHTLDRLDSFVLSVVGKRLTYEGLTA
jgi:transposase-like protein